MTCHASDEGCLYRRRMTEREKRLLEVIGEDAMEEIKRRNSVGPPSVLVA